MDLSLFSAIKNSPVGTIAPSCATIYGFFVTAELIAPSYAKNRTAVFLGKIEEYSSQNQKRIESASYRFISSRISLIYLFLAFLFSSLTYVAFYNDIATLDKLDVLIFAISLFSCILIMRFLLSMCLENISVFRTIFLQCVSLLCSLFLIFCASNLVSLFELAKLRASASNFQASAEVNVIFYNIAFNNKGTFSYALLFLESESGFNPYPVGMIELLRPPKCGANVGDYLKEASDENTVKFSSDNSFKCFSTDGVVERELHDVKIVFPVDLDTISFHFLDNDTYIDRNSGVSFFGFRFFFGYKGKKFYGNRIFIDSDRLDSNESLTRRSRLLTKKLKLYSSFFFEPQGLSIFLVTILHILIFSDLIVLSFLGYFSKLFKMMNEEEKTKPFESIGRVFVVFVCSCWGIYNISLLLLRY